MTSMAPAFIASLRAPRETVRSESDRQPAPTLAYGAQQIKISRSRSCPATVAQHQPAGGRLCRWTWLIARVPGLTMPDTTTIDGFQRRRGAPLPFLLDLRATRIVQDAGVKIE
jgi:hypothetical protein